MLSQRAGLGLTAILAAAAVVPVDSAKARCLNVVLGEELPAELSLETLRERMEATVKDAHNRKMDDRKISDPAAVQAFTGLPGTFAQVSKFGSHEATYWCTEAHKELAAKNPDLFISSALTCGDGVEVIFGRGPELTVCR